jgi:hypothetical protein
LGIPPEQDPSKPRPDATDGDCVLKPLIAEMLSHSPLHPSISIFLLFTIIIILAILSHPRLPYYNHRTGLELSIAQ